MKKSNNNLLLMLVLLIAAIFGLVFYMSNNSAQEINYTEFVALVKDKKIKRVSEQPPYLIFETEGKVLKVRLTGDKLSDDTELYKTLYDSKVDVDKTLSEEGSFVMTFLPIFLILFLLLGLILSSKKDGTSFNMKNVKIKMKKKITFKDVAGLEEAKQELEELVDFLKNPAKYHKIGARIPRGVLLMGQPGTGKTLLAKAVAGEAGVSFFNASGSEFVEMFVGMGASRVRTLFNKAKANSPAIIFIDEIDTIGGKRKGDSPNNTEREQTLNQLLVEMDGFDTNSDIIVMGATNRSEMLDKALLRPGRFDRHVNVDAPTFEERLAILKLHSKKKPLKNINLERLAKKTSGFVGAELENILNEAAILAARVNRSSIIQEDVNEAFERVIAGLQKRSKVMTDEEKKMVAYHEAGHAVIAHILPGDRAIQKISIIPRGKALGYVLHSPEEDKNLWTKTDFLNRIKISMGGRAAEEIIFNDMTSGASNDIEKATSIAINMVTRYGMSDLGPQELTSESSFFSSNNRVLSDKIRDKIDQSIKDILLNCYEEAKRIIKENMDKMHKVAAHLLEHEFIEAHEVEGIMAGATSV